MKNLKKILLFLLLIIPCYVKADMYSYDPDAIARANSYINEYSDRNKYLLFNKNYGYEAGTLKANSRFVNGGMLNKDEFLTTRVDGGSYLATGNEYWTMTPARANTMYTVSYILKDDKHLINDKEGVRVTEYVQHGAKVTGTGRKTDPWMFVTQYRVSVTSSNPEIGTVSPNEKYVSKGGDVSFDVSPKRGYRYIKSNCSESSSINYNKNTKKLTFANVKSDVGCIVDFDRAIYTFNLDNTNTSKKSVPEKIYLELDNNWFMDEDATTPIASITPPERTGYTFDGYSYNNTKVINNTGSIIKVVSPTGEQLDQLVQTLKADWNNKTYSISLNNTGATTNGSTSVNVKYDDGLVSTPTAAVKSYTVKYDLNGSGATSSKTTDTSNYTFDGWYTSNDSSGIKIINANGTLVNDASGYIVNNKWKKDGGASLVVKFSGGSITTPTLTKDGNTCKWYPNKNNNNNPINPNTSYTPTSNITLYAKCGPKTYDVVLSAPDATTAGSAQTTATYNATSLAKITVPKREYTVKFSKNNTGATATTTAKTSKYTFNGWYTESSGGIKVASNAATPALQKSVSGYTNSSKKWIRTEDTTTLHAQWTSAKVALPKVTLKGHTCSWNTKSDGTGTKYASEYKDFVPKKDITLYAICNPKTYTVTLDQNGATKDGSKSTTVVYFQTKFASITLPERKYTVSFNRNSSGATFGDTSAKTSTYSVKGIYTAAKNGNKVANSSTTPALQASVNGYTDANSRWTRDNASTKLYFQWKDGGVTLPSAKKNNKNCTWNTKSDGSGTGYAAESTYYPTKDITLYSVCTVNCKKWVPEVCNGKIFGDVCDIDLSKFYYGCNGCGVDCVGTSTAHNANWDWLDYYYCTNIWDGCEWNWDNVYAYKKTCTEAHYEYQYNVDPSKCGSGWEIY